LLDEGVFGLFSKLSIFHCLFSQVIRVVKHATMLAVGAKSVRLNFSRCSSCGLGLLPISAGPIHPPSCPLLEGLLPRGSMVSAAEIDRFC
jgi:hypothetical protein